MPAKFTAYSRLPSTFGRISSGSSRTRRSAVVKSKRTESGCCPVTTAVTSSTVVAYTVASPGATDSIFVRVGGAISANGATARISDWPRLFGEATAYRHMIATVASAPIAARISRRRSIARFTTPSSIEVAVRFCSASMIFGFTARSELRTSTRVSSVCRSSGCASSISRAANRLVTRRSIGRSSRYANQPSRPATSSPNPTHRRLAGTPCSSSQWSAMTNRNKYITAASVATATAAATSLARMPFCVRAR